MVTAVQFAEKDGQPQLVLSDNATARCAAEMWRLASRLCSQDRDVELNCSAATYLDASILQLVAMFRVALRAEGLKLRVTGVSPTIQKDFLLAGLSECLD